MLSGVTRRHFFRQTGFGIGSVALLALLDEPALPAARRPAAPIRWPPRPPHFAPKAKSVIYLFMAGAPSQLDLFDYKPKLRELDGQPIPEELVKGERFAFIKGTPDAARLARSRSRRHGAVGRRDLRAAARTSRAIADDIAHRPLDAHRRSSTTPRPRSS